MVLYYGIIIHIPVKETTGAFCKSFFFTLLGYKLVFNLSTGIDFSKGEMFGSLNNSTSSIRMAGGV